MKIDVEAIKRKDPSALRDLMPTVMRCARAGASKMGAEHLAEDVGQELYMLFLEKLVAHFDPKYNVEPILIQAGWRIASVMNKRFHREFTVDDENGLLEDIMNDINIGNSNEDLPVTNFEQADALEGINMSNFPGVVHANVEKPMVDPSSLIKTREKKPRKLSTSCARIREIRMLLGLSQEAFSTKLNIPLSTLLSYEYGRTPRVKPDTMISAERLFEDSGDVVRRNKRFDGVPMSQILAAWAKELNIKATDTTAMSEVLATSKSTIHRWLLAEIRPRPRELNLYDRNVKQAAKRINKSDKANL